MLMAVLESCYSLVTLIAYLIKNFATLCIQFINRDIFLWAKEKEKWNLSIYFYFFYNFRFFTVLKYLFYIFLH